MRDQSLTAHAGTATAQADAFRLLVNEVMWLMVEEELFSFVLAEAVTQPNRQTMLISGMNTRTQES